MSAPFSGFGGLEAPDPARTAEQRDADSANWAAESDARRLVGAMGGRDGVLPPRVAAGVAASRGGLLLAYKTPGGNLCSVRGRDVGRVAVSPDWLEENLERAAVLQSETRPRILGH